MSKSPPVLPETPSERVAVVTWYLVALNVAMTTREIAKMLEMSNSATWRLLCAISRVVPIYQDEDYVWRKCPR